jgi:hypothetical protein
MQRKGNTHIGREEVVVRALWVWNFWIASGALFDQDVA